MSIPSPRNFSFEQDIKSSPPSNWDEPRLSCIYVGDKIGIKCINDPVRSPKIETNPWDEVCELLTKVEMNRDALFIFGIVSSNFMTWSTTESLENKIFIEKVGEG